MVGIGQWALKLRWWWRRNGPCDRQIWLADQRRQQRQQVVATAQLLVTGQPTHPGVTRRVNLPAPQVIDHLAQQGALIGKHLGLKSDGALKSAVAQHTLAKPVNSENPSLVKIGYGATQFQGTRMVIGVAQQQRPDQRIIPIVFPGKSVKRLGQCTA